MATISPRRTPDGVAISNCCPMRARRTRERWSAFLPRRKARSPATSSAIQRRRVIEVWLLQARLHAFEEAALVLLLVYLRDGRQFLEKFTLARRQLPWNLHFDVHNKVSSSSTTQNGNT